MFAAAFFSGGSTNERAEPVARANERAWHVGCGAAFGAKHARGSSVTFGKNKMNTTPLAVFGIGAAELLLIAFIFGLLGFWIWMLVDCATKEEDQTQKIIWIIMIVLIGFIGAPLYFFIRKLPRKAKTI